jgi:uroporphyrinogen decarboxylase
VIISGGRGGQGGRAAVRGSCDHLGVTSPAGSPDASVPARPDQSVPARPDLSVPAHPDPSGPARPDQSGPARPDLAGSAFLKACRREPVPHTPVWFMRQAGRSLPEYRKVREGIAMLDACRTPELVAEITLQPVRRYGVDAAILFSDIVVPLKAIGVDLDIVPGVGPVVAHPIRSAADLDQLRSLEAADVGFITEAIRMLTAELGTTPLIGFAGAPFTLASYLVEGGPSRNHEKTKAMMYGAPGLWDDLMRRLAGIQATWLQIQIAAGASAVQLFDSWVGALPAADYARQVLPHSSAVLGALADTGVPRIHFGVGTGELLALMGQAGADIVGVDFRVPLDEAARRVGPDRALQGNLDPAVLFAPWDAVAARTLATLEAGRYAPGHIFNLGHGVIPETDPDVLARVVDLVHEASAV